MIQMEKKDFKKLKITMGQRQLHPAKEIETGALKLSAVRNDPSLSYIALEDFVDILEERKFTIDTLTLEIGPAEKTATTPASIDTTPANVDTTPASTDTTKIEVYTKKEVKAMSWTELRSAAKADPDVPGNKTKEFLTEALVGRPKFPQE